MRFTGERYIPGQTPKRIEDDHLARYRFACAQVSERLVLDVGCGVGYGARMMASAGARVVHGIDTSEEAIEIALKSCQDSRVLFFVKDALTYQPSDLYEVVVCFEVIEHIDQFHQALEAVGRFLHPQGLLLISSPNRLVTSPQAKTIYDKPANKFHCREFTPDELSSALSTCGLQVIQIMGQRQRRYFKHPFLRKLHNFLFRPDYKSSPIVEPARYLPRYFTLVAKKRGAP